MALLIGVLLALSVGLLTSRVGMDRDRALYPAVTMVVAAYYVLFAVMGASTQVLVEELLVSALFVAAAVAGFRRSLWLVVIALAGHGVFDLAHAALISNPGVPDWWPDFCLAYDVTAAAYLAVLLQRGNIRAAAGRSPRLRDGRTGQRGVPGSPRCSSAAGPSRRSSAWWARRRTLPCAPRDERPHERRLSPEDRTRTRVERGGRPPAPAGRPHSSGAKRPWR